MGDRSEPTSSLPAPCWLEECFAPPTGFLAAPLPLLCFLVAINSLVEPYLFGHDARLYALQILARLEPGGPNQDLYLLFGSQDRFTLFSPIVGPLVAALGLQLAFFLVFLVSKFIFFWSVLRLVNALVDDPAARFLGPIFFALVPAPFGGLEIFQLNECFLTPRPLANALVLFALERALAGRWLAPVLFLIGSFLLHPLMAAPGVAIFLCWAIYRAAGRRGLATAGVLLGIAGFVALLYQPLGNRVFGVMDDEWLSLALQMCYHVKPVSWEWTDWWRIAWAFAVGIGVAWYSPPKRAALLAGILAVAGAGLLGSVVAPFTHYRLLVQVSPYRAMWVLELLAVPLTVHAAVACWRRGTDSMRSFALGLLLLLPADPYYVPFSLVLVAAALFLPLAILFRGLDRQPRAPDWLWTCTVRTFVGTVALGLVYDLGTALVYLAVASFGDARPDLHPVSVLISVVRLWYRLPLLPAAVLLGRRLLPQTRPAVAFAALLLLWVGYQGTLFVLPRTDAYAERFIPSARQTAFVKSFLQEQPPPANGRFTVYWRRDLTIIWFDVRANSYFNGVQMSGASFDPRTAQEGLRRLGRVRRFEEEWGLKRLLVPDWERIYLGLDDQSPPAPPPTPADLRKLAEDTTVDFAILENRFDGLYAATDGVLYIYDCRKLRSVP